jgi:hypothetical protein
MNDFKTLDNFNIAEIKLQNVTSRFMDINTRNANDEIMEKTAEYSIHSNPPKFVDGVKNPCFYVSDKMAEFIYSLDKK